MLSFSTTQVPPPSDWQRFEHLCWLLWRAIWSDDNAQKNGRQGQPQNGVDVYGQLTKGRWAGVQCKGKDIFQDRRITERELKREVAKAKRFTPRLSQFVLATTGARDAKIQECARRITEAHRKKRLFSVQVYSWEDIRDLLAGHDRIVEELYAGAAFAKDSKSLLNDFEKRQRDSLRREFDSQTHTFIKAAFLAVGLASENGPTSTLLPDLSSDQIAEIAAILRGGRRKAMTDRTRTRPTAVLSASRTRLLGLLAASPVPFALAGLKGVFPDVDWADHVRYFKKRRLLVTKDGTYCVPSTITRSFIATNDDLLPYLNEWIAALEPLKSHPDIALFRLFRGLCG